MKKGPAAFPFLGSLSLRMATFHWEMRKAKESTLNISEVSCPHMHPSFSIDSLISLGP